MNTPVTAASTAAAVAKLATTNADAAAALAVTNAAAADRASVAAYDLAYYNALMATGQATIDRARAGAQTVQTAAAAIGTLYGGVLGVTFSVANRPLPFRGVIPAVFLGLAIAMSSVYLAYLRGDKQTIDLEALRSSPPERMQRRLDNFLTIIGAIIDRRVYWLRSSVVALSMGVLFLPAPFVALSLGPAPATTVNSASLDNQYPWPSPQTLAASSAPADQALYSAELQEVAGERQRALAQPVEEQAVGWLVAAAIGLVIVFLVPRKHPSKGWREKVGIWLSGADDAA